ncbi:MAG: valine--tRNA ligase [bacterium]|nr:valine--tRNA ligase [bacterium]
MNDKFLKPYNPQETEGRIYKLWEESGFFAPEAHPSVALAKEGKRPEPKPFTIIMPPANANGNLHAGHALVMTVEDIMTRYKRMRGYKTLWLPGLDHAGIETWVVYEKQLEKEGRSRFGMDPKALYEEIMAFTRENSKNIKSQIRKMGASCDWSREKFTLDADVVKTVWETFKKMYDDGLVYRGKRIVNWCSKHATSLSDVETESKEKGDPFYYFKYGPFIIGTTRPETKFGDKYVVMHPKDERYNAYKHGDTFELEWINGPITATVIKDEAIDMELGSGVMTITPWHTQIDFEIAERHNLPKEQVIDMRGKLLPIAGEFAGMKIAEARPKIVEKLKSKGLLVKIDENYTHNVPVCYKCETPIEPQVSPQWFVKMKPLAEKAVQAVEAGKITFIPDNYRKIFLYWMNNTLDWNISRQIVWGIKIPAKICTACGHGIPDLDNRITACTKCHGSVREDTDTFDTWFSSGQWPLVTLGYPDGKDLKEFYPTDVMESGSDLIFKWIPRMVIFGLYLTGEVPFKTVYLHGMVNDAKGQKMSKSKGNVISPLSLIEKFGTDALRIGLVAGNTPGTSLSLSEDKIRGYKNFANKLWNIARFIIENTAGETFEHGFGDYTEADAKLREERHKLLVDVTKDMEAYRFYMAAEKLYHYAWHTFADKILEESKVLFEKGTDAEKKSRKQLLIHTLDKILRCLHPFIPFVTEEIWQLWKQPTAKEGMLMVAEWPIK